MLSTRLVAAAAILIPVLTLFWLDEHYNFGRPGLWLIPLGILVGCAISVEWSQLLSQRPHPPRLFSIAAGTTILLVTVTLVSWFHSQFAALQVFKQGEWWALSTVLVLGLIVLEEMVRYREPGGVVERIALTFLAVIYSGLLMSFLFALRLNRADSSGLLALFSVICVTKCSDAGAYFVGKGIGRHRMTPLLSSKKTWEGAVGGIVAAVLAAWGVDWGLKPWWVNDAPASNLALIVLYGCTLALAGMFGDLAESLVKRDCQQKDSSHWLPGLGGTFDVFDSLLWAGPVGWVWWSVNSFGC